MRVSIGEGFASRERTEHGYARPVKLALRNRVDKLTDTTTEFSHVNAGSSPLRFW